MSYKLKPRKEFLEYIKKELESYPLDPSYEETLINNFSSSNLSDLYKLFLDLKGINLSEKLYNKLKDAISQRFSIDTNILLLQENDEAPFYVSSNNIKTLENIIKDKYLEIINTSSSDFDSPELYKLSLIVNKLFPEEFLKLIKNPDENSDINKQQKIIVDRIMDTINHWHLHNSDDSREENKDIAAALWITLKKLYPDLDIYIPGRVKSTNSSLNNINKEIKKNFQTLVPADPSKGLTDSDIEKNFDLNGANNDFSGLTIVLSNTDDVLHFDRSNPESKDIFKLRKERQENLGFIHSIENFLDKNDLHSIENLLQMKIELLNRLRKSTFKECFREYNDTSFNELFKKNLNEYNKHNNDNENFDDDECSLELDKLYSLIDELKKRVHDKYQFKLLEIVIPEILEDNLLSEELKLKYKFIKFVKKPNGFCSLYYYLTTPDGRTIELQAQSKERFRESKNGSATHSLLPNKCININDFFEPINPETDDEDFKSLLKTLDDTPIASKNVLYKTPDSELTAKQKRLKKRLRTADQNVKIKDFIDLNTVDENGSVKKMDVNRYLKLFAEYVSPHLFSVSSSHTRFLNSITAYNEKSLVSSFNEVLLKSDWTSCLAQKLIDRLEEILPNEISEVSRNGIIERAKKREREKNSEDSRSE